MRTRLLAAVVLLVVASGGPAQAPPAADKEPILRLEGGGPTAFVTGVALGPDGRKLFAAGFDKVVRSWSAAQDGWTLDRGGFRVPIGPGLNGAINAVAVSDDGAWVAAAGFGVIRDLAGFKQKGQILPDAGWSPERWRDLGVVFVFRVRDGAVRVLRGHTGPVLALAFVPGGQDQPLLISAGQDRDLESDTEDAGIRVWDVRNAAVVASRRLPKLDVRPTVAGWRVGNGPKDLMIASACNDGFFRVWNVANDRLAVRIADGTNNHALAVIPGNGGPKLLTASTGLDGVGSLRVWSANAAQTPAVAHQFPARAMPRALAPVASKPDGSPDHLAVILETPGIGDRPSYAYRLQVLTLDGWRVVRDVPLWSGNRNQPALAARGSVIAAGGGDAHEIRVYRLAGLLAGGDAAEPSVLRSAGATFRHAAFVVNDKAIGLTLDSEPKPVGGPPRAPAAGSLVFNLSKRGLTDDVAGWTVNRPELGEWSAKAAVGARDDAGRIVQFAVVVSKGGAEAGRILLRRGQVLSDFALLPPGGVAKRPVLAVAAHTRGQPTLALYDVPSGDRFRVYTGHTDPIRSVAFSADGRLLVTTAEDQTVNVWSLTNLEKFFGLYGMIRGVAVRVTDGNLAIARLELDGIPADNLKTLREAGVEEGSIIEGIEVGKELRKLATPQEFYEAVYRLKPGSEVRLRIRGKAAAVVLRVDQAIDERKPLFTLFVTRADRAAERDWIGWSPNGPYEYSDRKAERWIGWHFNTGDAANPAAFDAAADEYHKEFYRDGILRQLVAQGAIGPALKEWEKEDRRKPLPRPVLKPWIDGVPPEAEQAGRPVLVRQVPRTLRLLIGNVPPTKVAAVEYSIAPQNAPAVPAPIRRPFDPGDQVERTADVANLPWAPGVYRVRVYVRTAEELPREANEEFLLEYRPPVPAVALAEGVKPQDVVNAANFALAVEVAPVDDTPAVVRFAHIHDGQEQTAPKEATVKARTTLKPVFTLKPGNNTLRAFAVDAAGQPLGEPLTVTRVFTPKPTPVLTVTRVDGEPVEPGKPVVVAARKARVAGLFRLGDQETEVVPTAVLDITAGTLTATATVGDETARTTLPIVFRPALPRAILTLPLAGQQYFAPDDPTEVEVRGRLFPVADQQPYRLTLIVNGKDAGRLTPAEGGLEFVGKANLAAGNNRIAVRVENGWGAEAVTEAVTVRYLAPPVLPSKPVEMKTDKPLVPLTVVARSLTPLDKDAVEVEVQGNTVPVKVEVSPFRDGASTVTLTGVPLTTGPNRVEVWVRNADGRARNPAVWNIAFAPPAAAVPPPEVTFVEPGVDVRVTEPRQTIRFRVRSAAQPDPVVLLRDLPGNPLRLTIPANAVVAVPGAAGLWEATAEVTLIPGANPLKALAVNAGGQGDATVTVSYLSLPVELVVDRLVPRGQEESPMRPTITANGRLTFSSPAPSGRVRVYGRVLWSKDNDAEFKSAQTVRVFVNGFQQPPATLLAVPSPSSGDEAFAVEAAARPERRFVADLMLNQGDENRVEIELPGLKQRATNRRGFTVACSAPETVKRWHVLPVVVTPGGEKRPTEDELIDRVRKAFPASTGAAVKVYGPLSRFVTPQQVLLQLAAIKRTIERTASVGSGNDVVVLYYQGGEMVGPGGHFLLTNVSEADRDFAASAVTVDGVARLFGQTLGAQVLLFDVARDPESSGDKLNDVVAQWPDDPNVAVLRYSRRTAAAPSLIGDFANEAGTVGRLGPAVQGLAERKFSWRSDQLMWESRTTPGVVYDWRVSAGLGGLPVAPKR